MKIREDSAKIVKTCHVRPGDCIRLYDNNGEPIGTYIVASAAELKSELGSSGLYNANTQVFLVSLTNGLARPLPHLSARLCEKLHAEVCLYSLEGI